MSLKHLNSITHLKSPLALNHTMPCDTRFFLSHTSQFESSNLHPFQIFSQFSKLISLAHLQLSLSNISFQSPSAQNHCQIHPPSSSCSLEFSNQISSCPFINFTYSAHSLVRALVHSRLDYCNGVLAGMFQYHIDRLQSVLRAAALLVLGLPKWASVSDAIHDKLHWLPFPEKGRVQTL